MKRDPYFDATPDAEDANLLVFRKNIKKQDCWEEQDCDHQAKDAKDERLSGLSFWNKSAGCLSDPEDERSYIKFLAYIIALILIGCMLGLAYKFVFLNKSDVIPVMIRAPEEAHKITPPKPDVQDSLIYGEPDKPTEPLYDDFPEDPLPQKKEEITFAPTIKPAKPAPSPKIPVAKRSTVKSFYIHLGLFNSHCQASLKWKELKSGSFVTLRGCQPMIRMIPSDSGKQYELLAGPVSKEAGVAKCKQLGQGSRLLSVAD